MWFLRYIVICYIIFYIVSKIVNILKFKNNEEIYFLLFIFALWFAIESLFFANPDMPFLEARQMLSFPLGVIIAKYKDKIVNIIHKLSYTQNIFIVFGGGSYRNCIYGRYSIKCDKITAIYNIKFIIITNSFTVSNCYFIDRNFNNSIV